MKHKVKGSKRRKSPNILRKVLIRMATKEMEDWAYENCHRLIIKLRAYLPFIANDVPLMHQITHFVQFLDTVLPEGFVQPMEPHPGVGPSDQKKEKDILCKNIVKQIYELRERYRLNPNVRPLKQICAIFDSGVVDIEELFDNNISSESELSTSPEPSSESSQTSDRVDEPSNGGSIQ